VQEVPIIAELVILEEQQQQQQLELSVEHILALQIHKFRLLVEQVGLEVLVVRQLLVGLDQQEVLVGLAVEEEVEEGIMEQDQMVWLEQHFLLEGLEQEEMDLAHQTQLTQLQMVGEAGMVAATIQARAAVLAILVDQA
jgi:hypothetical protein